MLVFSNGGRSMGLLVDEIVDIAEGALHIDVGSATPGILGSAIVNGTATEILDVCHWLSQAFFDGISGAQSGQTEQPLLLVEDSEFFRALLQPVLNAAGYSVTALPDARAALTELRGGRRFCAIISDLSMPGMSGLEFAQEIRADSRFVELPLIAIAPHAGAPLREEIRKAGFSEFVAKFDRAGLLAAVRGATMDRLKDAA